MDTATAWRDSVAFSYRAVDRLILNAYVPRLQTPGAVAGFLRQVRGMPILSGIVFKRWTDQFVDRIKAFAARRGLDIEPCKGRQRPGAMAQAALKRAARQGRYGVVAIVVHQEMARVFASHHAGGRDTNFWVKEGRRLVNHYYFYIRDEKYGEGFVRYCTYPPFACRIWMNGHGHLEAQMRERDVPVTMADNCVASCADPEALQKAADRFNAKLVEKIARRWLSMVPAPLSKDEQRAGYERKLSIFQVEFCDNQVFKNTATLNRIYEHVLKEHLHLGRLDMVKIMFDRRITRRTPGRFSTRVLRQGAVSCLKVFYKKSWLKQYNKAGKILRTELCLNDTRDVGVNKGLANLDYLRTIAHHTLTRFQKAQAVATTTALDRSTFERITTPSQAGGQRVAAIRFGAPRTMRVLEAVVVAGLCFCAFSVRELRQVMIDRLGVAEAETITSHLSYELRKLRGKGLLRKAAKHNRYTLTDVGYKASLFFTKTHQRVLGPALESFDPAIAAALHESDIPIDRCLRDLNRHFDRMADLCGLRAA